MEILLKDINNLKNIQDTEDENMKFDKLFELLSNNNNLNEINNDIKNKCNNITIINDEINEKINTKSKDFNFIKAVCEDSLSNTAKNKIIGDLFCSSDNEKDRQRKDEYNAKRRARRLKNKNQEKNNE